MSWIRPEDPRKKRDQRDRAKRRYARLVALGLCTQCGKQPAVDTLCAACKGARVMRAAGHGKLEYPYGAVCRIYPRHAPKQEPAWKPFYGPVVLETVWP